ncbi:Lrp/AsnC family transcriptional regulator, partial [Ralstonia solanacearum]
MVLLEILRKNGGIEFHPEAIAMPLDRRDIQLLNLLQDDATLPLRTLAERVHMSVATCQRRIAQMR